MCETSKCVPLEALQSSMQLKTKDKGLVITRMQVNQPDLAGDHFVSAVETIDVDFTLSNEKKGQVHLFVKYIPDNEVHQARVAPTQVSYKEVKFYEEVIPTLQHFCDENNAEIPLRFPTCYYAKNDGVYDAVALENLSKAGFRMFRGNTEGQDLKHCKLFIDALAQYHAVSFALLKKRPEVEYWSFLKDRVFSEPGKQAFGDICTKAFFNALLAMEGDPEYQEALKGLKIVGNALYDVTIEMVKNPGPFKVINHGDCWTNNMTFRYDSNGNPTEVVMFDMQLVRVAALTVDLVYFFFTSTGPELRKNHLDQLLKLYYQMFTSTLEKLGVTDCGFNVSDLKEDFRRRSALIMIFVANILAIRLCPKSDFDDPGSESKTDSISLISEAAKKAALNPTTGKIVKRHMAAAFEEIKYSFQCYGLEV